MVSWLLEKELLPAANVKPAPLAKYSDSAWLTTDRTAVFFNVMFWRTRFAPEK